MRPLFVILRDWCRRHTVLELDNPLPPLAQPPFAPPPSAPPSTVIRLGAPPVPVETILRAGRSDNLRLTVMIPDDLRLLPS